MLLELPHLYTTSKCLHTAKHDIVVYKKFYMNQFGDQLLYSTPMSNIFGIEIGDLIERELVLDDLFYVYIKRLNHSKLTKVGLVHNGIVATYRPERLLPHYLEVVMECIIPKGAKYVTNLSWFCLISSDKLIITRKHQL